MSRTTLIGWLGEVATSPDHEFWLEQEDGTTVQLHFEGPHRTPIGPKIAISVDQDNHVIPIGAYYTYIQDTPTNLEDRRFLFFRQLRPRFMGNDDKPPETDEDFQKRWDQAMAESTIRAAQTQDFYQYIAGHIWNTTVEPYVYESSNSVDSPDYDKALIYQAIEDQGIAEGYYGVMVHSRFSSPVDGRCGSAYRHGRPIAFGVVYEGCSQHTHDHESGHRIGMGHAGERTSSGGVYDYGDSSCIMAGGTHRPGFNAPHSLWMGAESVREQRIVDTSTQVLLCPKELDEHSMFTREDQSVIVRIPGHEDHALSLRKKTGTHYRAPKYPAETLYIHTGRGSTVLEEKIRPGEGYDQGDTEIEYLEYDEEYESARINIRKGLDPVPANLKPISGFPPKLGTVELTPEYSGLWYEPRFNRVEGGQVLTNRQGFDLHMNDSRMVIYWYTYNEREDSRRWYYGAADLSVGVEEFPLWTRDGKTGESIRAGDAQLYFFNKEHGVFNYRTTDHHRGSMDIAPVAFSDSPDSNVYYDPAYPNTGFSIQFVNNMAIAYWYDYGTASGAHPPGIQTQRWYECSGIMNRGGWYDLTIYEYTGGLWRFFDHSTQHVIGKATLKIDGDYLVFKYETAVGTTGTRNLTHKVL